MFQYCAVMSAIMYSLSTDFQFKHVIYLHTPLKWSYLHKTLKKLFRHSTRNHSSGTSFTRHVAVYNMGKYCQWERCNRLYKELWYLR